MLSPFTASSSSSHKTGRRLTGVTAEQKSLWELSRPLTFRCSSLMLIPQRCQMKTHRVVLYAKAREGSVGRAGRGTWEGERGQKVLWMSGRGESQGEERWREERREENRANSWNQDIGLTGSGEGWREEVLEEGTQWRWGCISSTSQANYSAAASSLLSLLCLRSRCPLLSLSSSLFLSHFLYLCSNYPCAVSSNRSLNDTSLHWQVLSSRATIGKKDLRRDKIGPTNSDNSKHIMARCLFDTVLHCHLVASSSAGAPSQVADH